MKVWTTLSIWMRGSWSANWHKCGNSVVILSKIILSVAGNKMPFVKSMMFVAIEVRLILYQGITLYI